MLPFFSVKENTGEPISTEEAAAVLKEGVKSLRFSQSMCLYTGISNKRYYVPCYRYFRAAFELAKSGGAGVGFWEGGNGLEIYYKFM